MKKIKINEKFSRVEELLRKANALINPITTSKELQWLQNKDSRNKLFELYPKCFLKMNIGQKHLVLPVCNRSGMIDPSIVSFSIKLANKYANKPDVNQEELVVVLKKLEMLYKKFSNDIPKPADMAERKGRVTKLLNNIKDYLKPIRG